MDILINCRSFLSKNYTGIGRYAFNLVKSLTEVDLDNHYILYAAKAPFDKTRRVPPFRGKNISIKVDWLKRDVEGVIKNFDIYHSPCPDMIRYEQKKIVVTSHDLVYKAFPQGHTQQTLELTDQQYRSFLPKVSRLITLSESTKRDLIKYFSFPSDKINVIYPGVDKSMFYPVDDSERESAKESLRKLGVETPFILFVGTIEPRKNLKNIFNAFSILKNKNQFKGKLVVVGMKGWKQEKIEEQLERLGIRQDVVFLGFITNDDLRHLYNLAQCCVFPSLYEGFGFPIIEAFHCGCPVVTSNVSSCPEIAGNGALIVDPHSPESIAKAVYQIIQEPQLRKELIEKGFKRTKEFCFLKTAKETLEIYKEVCGRLC